ncbi:alpha/beta hydrolase [Streptomyces caniscabiei]|uniref:alpha/beta fold hydrolase n=1 Tax=Streptomyces caniscabiei TaxID=2746961 RepID=UPI0029A224B0|nr:alpha/beta hydrolase [Streptomyces caniscabiei]MDX2776602.1 alpha/beta hydrolase [Streptomyces caniscabiei]
MQNNKLGIIFISGAGLQPWIWQEAAKEIPLPYATIDFTDLKKGKRLNDITIDDYVQAALAQVAALNVEKAIIVTHSIGGIIGTELAKRLGDKVAGFAAACAAIPRPGKSFLSLFPFPQSFITGMIMRIVGTKPPASAIKSGLCNDIDDATASRVADSFDPESIKLYTTPTSSTPLPQVPSLYIITTNDKEYPLDLQRTMADQLGATIIQIDAGHLPMISKTNETVAAIQTLIQKVQ